MRLNKRARIIAILVVAFVLVSACSVLWDVFPPDISGTWNFTFTWPNSSPGSATWVLASGGTFTDPNEGGNGTWVLNSNKFTLTYTVNGNAIYSGTLADSATTMSGTMTSGGSTGTWTASKQ